jgi:uncharacterized OsmC-like protein
MKVRRMWNNVMRGKQQSCVVEKSRCRTDGTSTVDQFHRLSHLDADLTEEQRMRLLEIAERCPVSYTLRHSSAIDSRLADAAPPIAA